MFVTYSICWSKWRWVWLSLFSALEASPSRFVSCLCRPGTEHSPPVAASRNYPQDVHQYSPVHCAPHTPCVSNKHSGDNKYSSSSEFPVIFLDWESYRERSLTVVLTRRYPGPGRARSEESAGPDLTRDLTWAASADTETGPKNLLQWVRLSWCQAGLVSQLLPGRNIQLSSHSLLIPYIYSTQVQSSFNLYTS